MTGFEVSTDPLLEALTRPLPYALRVPTVTAGFKRQVDDFVVEEQCSVELSGEGEHLWLWVESRDRNTQDLMEWVAKEAKVAKRAVGHSGLKDKRAVTRQWLSVHLPGKADPVFPSHDGFRVLQVKRHHRKLKVGAHHSNRFEITLRDVDGGTGDLDARLAAVMQWGVPNYYGPQRFGHNNSNVKQGLVQFGLIEGKATQKRRQRSLALSSLRSAIFNQVLAERVRREVWRWPVNGDVIELSGTRSNFVMDSVDLETIQRVFCDDVFPSGPLVGRSLREPTQIACQFEQSIRSHFLAVESALSEAGLEGARRAYVVKPKAFSYHWRERNLTLSFVLPKGCFATSVLRELVNTI